MFAFAPVSPQLAILASGPLPSPDVLEAAPIASACRDLLAAGPIRGIDVPAVITGATIDVNGGACFG